MSDSANYICILPLLLAVSLNCFANENWVKREVHVQCGPALLQVETECKVSPQSPTINMCKRYTLNIVKDSNITSYELPYMPDSQRKSLENQGYNFNKIVSVGDWAPQTLNCYDNEIIIIGYTTGSNDEEGIDDSLTSNTSAPFFDLNGEFINNAKEVALRKRELHRKNGYVSINFTNNVSGE